MKAIETHYLGATNFKGSRIVASDSDGNRVCVGYDHGASDPHEVAARALCAKMGWSGKLTSGHTKRGKVFVFAGDSILIPPPKPDDSEECPACNHPMCDGCEASASE